jgi:membrane protein YdbS with pleckstrin-like domain
VKRQADVSSTTDDGLDDLDALHDQGTTAYRSLDARAVALWRAENVVGIVVVVALAWIATAAGLVPDGWDRAVRGIAGVLVGLSLLDATVLAPLRYRHFRYTVTPEVLVVEQGRFWKRRQVYPLARVLYCETRQGPVLGVFGVFSVRAATIVGSRSIGPLSQAESSRIEQAVRERT